MGHCHAPSRKVPSHGTDALGQRYAFDLLRTDYRNGMRFCEDSMLKYWLVGVLTSGRVTKRSPKTSRLMRRSPLLPKRAVKERQTMISVAISCSGIVSNERASPHQSFLITTNVMSSFCGLPFAHSSPFCKNRSMISCGD